MMAPDANNKIGNRTIIPAIEKDGALVSGSKCILLQIEV